MKTPQPKSTEKSPLPKPLGFRFAPAISTFVTVAFAAFGVLGLAPQARAVVALDSTNVWVGGGADPLFSTAANWSPSGPGSRGLALLTNSAATGVRGTNGMGHVGTPNIIINVDTRIGALSFVNTNQLSAPGGGYHTLEISNNVTLTVSNTVGTPGELTNILAVAMGGTSSGQFANDYGANTGIYGTVQGEGTLEVICTNGLGSNRGNIAVIQGSAGGATDNDGMNATLDLSGLNTFKAAVNRIHVGSDPAGNFFFKRAKGTLYLAKTNILSLWANGNSPQGGTYTHGLMVGAIANNGYVFRISKVFLGLTNAIYTDAGIGVALRRASATLAFNPSNGPSSAYFRGLNGGSTRQTVWSIGDCRGGSPDSYDITGTADFSGGTIDAMVGTIQVGRGPTATTGGAIGVLTFNSGILDVNTANIGVQQTSNIKGGYGTVNVGSNAVMVVNTAVALGTTAGTLAAGGFYGGVINITGGGQVNVANTATVTCGTGSTNEINVSGGSSLKVPGIASTANPLNVLRVSGSTLTLDLGANPNPVSPVCTANFLETGAGITLNVLGSALSPGVVTLIKYNTSWGVGSFSDFATFNHPTTGGYLSNDVANASIVYVITNSTAALITWNGQTNSVNVDNWDIFTTANWKNGASPSTYAEGSLVQFDDTAAGSGNVNLTTILTPAFMSVTNDSKNYTFTGSGALRGAGGLNKFGTGSLTIGNTGSNGFAGSINIFNGSVALANAADRLPASAAVTVADVATAGLNLNGLNQTIGSLSGGGSSGGNVNLGAGNLTIRGGGGSYAGVISGAGALVKTTSGTQTLTGENLYSGGTVVSNSSLVVANINGSGLGSGSVFIGAGGNVQLGNGTTANGAVAAPIITNNGTLGLLPTADYTLTNIIVGSGSLQKLGGGASATIYITNNNSFTGGSSISQGRLQISSPQALGTGQINLGNFTADDTWLALSGGITVANTIGLPAKTGAIVPPVPHIKNMDGTNTLTGNLTLTGSTVFGISAVGGSTLILAGNLVNQSSAASRVFLEGDGAGIYQGSFNQGAGQPLELDKVDSGTWTLAGANTYSDATVVSGGKLIVNGSISNSSRMFVGFGAALAGTGVISSPTTNVGTIFPGDDGTIGALTINNALLCDGAGTVSFDVNTNGNDTIRGLTSVEYHGTLQVNALGTVTGNSVFKLFSAASYSGTFDATMLPDISGAGLAWDTSYLTVDGTLRATNGAAIAGAVVTSTVFSGNKFVLTGTIGWQVAPVSVLATTNLATPLANWSNLGEGVFTNGVFSFADTLATNYPVRFYRFLSPIAP